MIVLLACASPDPLPSTELGCDEEWHTDLDGDGFGRAEVASYDCEPPAGHVADGTDCDDADPTAFPGAHESCEDADGDGFGSTATIPACENPGLPCTDCDDADADVHPYATEHCDGIDENCDGEVDQSPGRDAPTWIRDADGDGYPPEGADEVRACAEPEGYSAAPKTLADDCDDTDASVQPYGPDDCGDDIDQNCNGLLDDLCYDVTRSVADADTTFSTPDAYEEFAANPIAVGDASGDGLPDLGVQASRGEYAERNVATVYVFDGRSSGNVSTAAALAAVRSDLDSGIHGPVAAAVPDADGDGYDDLGLLAFSTSTTIAWIFRGPFAGDVDPTHAWAQITGESALRRILPLGDLDGDGLGDLAIASDPETYPFQVLAGVVAGEQALSDFGGLVDDRTEPYWVAAVATLDNDGDGRDELVIRADDGVIHVFQLPVVDGQALSDADKVIAIGADGDLASGDLIDGGDFTGDGRTDLLVGGPYHEDAYEQGGAAWIVDNLDVGDEERDWQWATLLGARENAYFGYLLAVGDLDGDTRPDIVGGIAPLYGQGVYGFLAPGPGTRSTDDAELGIYGMVDEVTTGLGLLIPGDTDGDGADDLLITSEHAWTHEGIGAAWLFRGGDWLRP